MKMKSSPSWYSRDKAYFLMIDENNNGGPGRKKLKDHLFNTVTLQHKGLEVRPAKFVMGHYLLTGIIENEKVISLPVFDLEDLKVVGILDESPDEITESYFIYLSENMPNSKTVEYIKDLRGNTIYSIAPSSRVFKSTKEALQYASEATILLLNDPKVEEWKELGQLKKLEIIELRNFKGEQLPEQIFTNHQNLKQLTIKGSPQLQSLPSSVNKLVALEFVTIYDCPNLHQLETNLQYWPMLKQLKTDLRLTPEIRVKYPDVKFVDMPSVIKMD